MSHGFRWDVAREEAVAVNVSSAFLVQSRSKLPCEENGTKHTSGVSLAGVKGIRPFNPGGRHSEVQLKLLSAHMEGGRCYDDS